MNLYILVHHSSDPIQPYENVWLDNKTLDPSLLASINTKHSLAQKCEIERLAGNRVFIHRCAYKKSKRLICASALVSFVDLTKDFVTFTDHQPTALVPPKRAAQSQISYNS